MGANCLLISANKMVSPYPVYPIGIAYLSGALVQNGHHVQHVDVLADGSTEKLSTLLNERNFDVIGISIRNIDTVNSSFSEGLLSHIEEVIDIIRKQSTAPVVLGGPGFSIMPAEILDFLGGDYGVVGEGESVFPELIDKIISGEPIAEKLFYGSITPNPWIRPVFYDSIASYYLNYGGMLGIQTKRGCCHRCSYCSYPTIEGRKMRYRDPKEVAEEVQRLGREHQARYIFFTDGVFNDNRGHYLQVAEELIRLNNTVPWCAFFRPQHLSREKLKLLKKSGMASMELGTDASSDNTLSGLNKGFTFDEVHRINEDAVAESIPCAHFIMFGGPEETEDSVLKGLDNIDRLPPSVVFAYSGIRIFPGTELYERALEEKILKQDQSLLHPLFYFSPHVSKEFIDRELHNSFKDRTDRIYSDDDMEVKIQMLHMMGHDGPLWDGLIFGKLKRLSDYQ